MMAYIFHNWPLLLLICLACYLKIATSKLHMPHKSSFSRHYTDFIPTLVVVNKIIFKMMELEKVYTDI